MKKNSTSSIIMLTSTLMSLTACSTIEQVGKSTRSMVGSGQQSSNTVAVDEKLVIPPSLKVPGSETRPSSSVRTNQRTTNSIKTSAGKNYYIVVGTYPDQTQALDTFVRLSSIGLPGAAMESRKTKSGQILHMVRLGPYQKQRDIDQVTNDLTSDGLTQFKVVEN